MGVLQTKQQRGESKPIATWHHGWYSREHRPRRLGANHGTAAGSILLHNVIPVYWDFWLGRLISETKGNCRKWCLLMSKDVHFLPLAELERPPSATSFGIVLPQILGGQQLYSPLYTEHLAEGMCNKHLLNNWNIRTKEHHRPRGSLSLPEKPYVKRK